VDIVIRICLDVRGNGILFFPVAGNFLPSQKRPGSGTHLGSEPLGPGSSFTPDTAISP
jgi:hypothetical protein